MMCGYAYGENYEQRVKKISNEAVKGLKTFEDKVQALKVNILEKIPGPPPTGMKMSDKQVAILEKYYKMVAKNREDGDIFTRKDYEIFYNPLRIIMREKSIDDFFDFGYGWCDDTTYIFTVFARKQGITTNMVFLFSRRDPAHEQHTIAEALSPEGRWVIVDLDPHEALDLIKNGKMFTRRDIANNREILYNDSAIERFPENSSRRDKGFMDMFFNELGRVVLVTNGEEIETEE
jgi:hypothetical protein